MIGDHQVKNCVLAINISKKLLGSSFDISTVKKSVKTIKWPGRLEKIKNKNMYYDVAHNVEGISAMIKTISNSHADKKVVGLFSLKSDKNIWLVLNSPLMSSDEKSSFLENFLTRLKNSSKVLNLFSLILKNNRLNQISDLIDCCQQRLDILNAVSNVELISAEEFSSEQQKEIIIKLKKMGFENVNLSTSINPDLVFGYKLLVNNKEFDMSLNSVFKELKENIIKVN